MINRPFVRPTVLQARNSPTAILIQSVMAMILCVIMEEWSESTIVSERRRLPIMVAPMMSHP